MSKHPRTTKNTTKSTSSSSSDLFRFFSTQKQMDVYIANFQKWDIVTPRYLDAQFFSQVDLDVYRLLDRWGLIKLLTIKELVYPELVKVLNTNLRHKDEYVFLEVKGVKTNIDFGLFYELLGLSFDGEKLLNKGVAPKE